MASPGLTAQPLNTEGAFNWIYLLDCIVDGILCLAFLFYFNRLFATVVSYAIRLVAWHKFRIYIDIQALQISPLAGRIFFKGIRYHGDNITLLIHGGYITWRYWYPKVKDCQVFTNSLSDRHETKERVDYGAGAVHAKVATHTPKKPPCRISIKVSGVEAFIYNRSPSYDAIIELVRQKNAGQGSARNSSDEKAGFHSSHVQGTQTTSSDTSNDTFAKQKEKLNSSKKDHLAPHREPVNVRSHQPQTPPPPALLRLLPIRVEVNTGAAVLGNENTKSIVTAKFDSASGEFDAATSGPLDLFKILMSFDIIHPYIQMKPNIDYKQPQLAEAVNIQENLSTAAMEGEGNINEKRMFRRSLKLGSSWLSKSRNIFSWPNHSNTSIVGAQHRRNPKKYTPILPSPPPSRSIWLGLTRYLDDVQGDEHREWDQVEYAKSSVLADVKALGLTFFWDIPGPVKFSTPSAGRALSEDINGTTPPEYGIDLSVRGGFVTYGPWADRHRVILQQIFFPGTFADATPVPMLKIGEARVCTIFNLTLKIEDDVTLRIPFREASKDWKWKGRASALAARSKGVHSQSKGRARRRKGSVLHRKRANVSTGADIRPFAWFDVTVKPNSTIKYDMDMIARPSGFKNTLSVNVSGIEIYSSLNHALLWRSGNTTITSDLSYPLQWNRLRPWRFDITISGLDLFLLRDHTFLLVDLIQDWSAGPLPDFLTFVPFRYLLNVRFNDFKMYLNINDANIVNNSEDIEDNEFVILYGSTLDAELSIPLDRFRPEAKDINFDVDAHELGFRLSMPLRNTLSTLVSDKDVAQLGRVTLHGTYNACSEVSPGLVDTMHMEIVGQSFTMGSYGFFIRQLVKLKENYFGDSVHFTTSEEYQDLVRQIASGIPIDRPHPVANGLDVILDIQAHDVNVLLPANIYNCEEYVRIHVDIADVDLRVSNYYLELMVNSTPLDLSYTFKSFNGSQKALETSGTQLFLDGVKVYGHRLFGSEANEPTYVSNWDIDAGSIKGECSVGFLEMLIAAGQCLALTISDAENAQPVMGALVLPDATFVRFACPLISIWCNIDSAALHLTTGAIQGSFSDWATTTFSQRLNMSIPDIVAACIDRNSTSHQGGEMRFKGSTSAYVKTSINFQMVQRALHFDEQHQAQRTHILSNDQPTSRARFLVSDRSPTTNRKTSHLDVAEALPLPVPVLPGPLEVETPLADGQHISAPLNLKYGVNGFGSHQKWSGSFDSYSAPQRTETTNDHFQCGYGDGRSPHSTAFTSVFKAPYFPQDDLEVDLTQVPRIQPMKDVDSGAVEIVDDVEFNETYDDAVHTSFIVRAIPGISLLCTPEAVRAAQVLLDGISPQQPEGLLDRFQATTVTEVLNSYSKQRGTNTVIDLKASVPHMHVRFNNDVPLESETNETTPWDSYNLIANDAAVTCRFKTVPQRQAEADSVSVHGTMGYLALSAQEGHQEHEEEDAAFQVVVENILIWAVESDRTSINASIQRTEVSMASRKVEYLAQLIHRTTILVDGFQADFAVALAQPERRLRYLVYSLVKLGNAMPDPAFLTRPSYAIRASPDHIRNSDSWKIFSRLRHIYQNLPTLEREQIEYAYSHDKLQCPPDAETYVMSALGNWRSWDSLMVNESFAVRIIYGSTGKVETLGVKSKVTLGLVVRLGRFKLVIDPGPKPNKFSVHDLAVRLSIRPPSPPSALAVFQEYDEEKITVLQINSSKFALNLNWKICSLVDHILTLFERKAPRHRKVEDETDFRSSNSGLDPVGILHIIFSVDFARAKLATIHLVQVVACDALKISVTGVGWDADAINSSVNAVVAAKMASTEMFGHHRLLWHANVTAPNTWLAYDRTLVDNKWMEQLKIAADSRSATVRLADEILGLVEIANAVLGDEVVYLNQLAHVHDDAGIKISGTTAPRRGRFPLQMDVMLLLNTYEIDVAILDDLHYSATGRIARLFVAPDRHLESTYQVGFDIKAQTHQLLAGALESSRCVADMEMPPINGTVRLLHSDDIVTLSATVSIEKIEFDAAAIHGIATILGSTRVSSAIDSIKDDIAAVRTKAYSIFPNSTINKAVESPKKQKSVIFDANLVFAGFSLSAIAPSVSGYSAKSEVIFNMQSIYVRAANRSAKDNTSLPFPEFRIALEQVSLELQHEEADIIRDCGGAQISAFFTCTVTRNPSDTHHRNFHLSITGPAINIFAETAPTAAEILSHLQSKLKDVNLSMEKTYLRRLRHLDRSSDRQNSTATDVQVEEQAENPEVTVLTGMTSSFAFNLQRLQVRYLVRDSVARPVSYEEEYLALTLESMNLLARSEEEARLSISNLQLALVPMRESLGDRPPNSALLPEVVFNVKHKSTKTDRRLAFHAAGKALDIQIEPQFILPASDIQRSIATSRKNLQRAAANLVVASQSTGSGFQTQKIFGTKTLSSMLFSADFAGAVVQLHGKNKDSLRKSSIAALHLENMPQHGRYGQFAGEDATGSATFRAPGVAFRVKYGERPPTDPTLNIEVRVSASDNVIYPAVVPLILQISESVKQIVRDPEPEEPLAEPTAQSPRNSTAQKLIGEDVLISADAAAILGKTRLNFALHICRQEFSLSCQPIAKVAATARLEDMYFTINSINSPDNGTFLAASAAFKGLQATLKHVYSREGTFNFEIDSVIVSLMNSKHFSGVAGISAILKINPTRAQINAKQLQDVLLFREIWLPPEIRNAQESPATVTSVEPQDYFVQRYKKIADTTAFPWHATLAVAELGVDLDLGQAIGRSSFCIKNLWASSKKTTSSQQNLCIGIDEVSMRSSGRMSGFVGLEKVKVRTSIAWPPPEDRVVRTPLIQASVGFGHLQAKAAFDYQTFAVADITRFEFIMYNVRVDQPQGGDRLVAILDGDKVNAYCIAASAAIGVSLYQAFHRLIQERAASYEQSLREIEKFLRRRVSVAPPPNAAKIRAALRQAEEQELSDSHSSSLTLHTDVVVTLKAFDVGVYPTTLMDHQIFKADAYDVQARFAANLRENKVHSGLSVNLGQLRVALAAIPHGTMPKTLGETTADEVLANAAAARGGIILRVPKVHAAMQTWQPVGLSTIDYIFKSTFEGKIDVGWNYSRISFIRGMWTTHTSTLASRLGKPLPESAVKIHGAPLPAKDVTAPGTATEGSVVPMGQQKITAVVNLPQSRYTYNALEPPVIETPQLRDMGEATPPLEWIGLQRDRLPHVTHQILIVTLLEVAREVEDAYSRILGSA